METENSSGNVGGFELHAGIRFHKTIDFDKRALRRALNKGAAEVRKAARRLVARKAISGTGQFPGTDTGTLKRAIGIVSRGRRGGWVKVGVKKTPQMEAFYPAFLFYGSQKIGLAKRGNYITAALADRRDVIRNDIRAALKNSLVPR